MSIIRCGLGVLSFLLATFAAASHSDAQSKEGSVGRWTIRANGGLSSVVGVFLRTDGRKDFVLDLKTFTEREIDHTAISRKLVPISERGAALSVGVAPIVAWQLKQHVPGLRKPGKIAALDQGVAYITLGKGSGIRVGHELSVFRGETLIRDPDTGAVLGKKRKKVARVRVIEVRDRLSKVKLVGELEVGLVVGDTIETDRKVSAIAVLPGTTADGRFLKSGVALANEIVAGASKLKVAVVERKKLLSVVGELALQRTGVFDPKTVQKLGHQVGAFAIVATTIVPNGRKSKVSVRLIEVETGKVLYATSIDVAKLDTRTVARIDAGAPPKPPGGKGDLPAVTDLRKLTYGGSWVLRDKKLYNTADESRLRLPNRPGRNYSFTLTFTRLEGKESLNVMMPVGNSNVTLAFSQDGGGHHSLNFIDGKSGVKRNDNSGFRPGTLVNKKTYTATISVGVEGRNAAIAVILDGKKIIDWKGLTSSLSSKPPAWQPADRKEIGIGVTKARFEISRIILK